MSKVRSDAVYVSMEFPEDASTKACQCMSLRGRDPDVCTETVTIFTIENLTVFGVQYNVDREYNKVMFRFSHHGHTNA